jgi:serine/threonine-protein kinase
MPRMDVKTWTTISRLLDEALDLPQGARSAWLDGLGREYETVKPRLRELLAQAAAMDHDLFLATLPKLDVPGDHTDEPARAGESATDGAGSRVGARVGPFTLVRPIASGGQGSVWLAERTDGVIARPVALKLPHGLAFRPGLAERMARERDILATLSHPHIARLYDAGVTHEGEPYMALEYVEGTAIDVHTRERALTIPDRVRLFLRVIRAVSFAHGQLVIHRDLKPSNILVTPDGDVRLLDFGIAKLLGGEPADSTLTREAGRAMTVAYASPEQVAQRPLSVASDVYSLGVVLFELLAGVRPYRVDRESVAALEEAVLTGEPRQASEAAETLAARKALKGDLDTILAKALKKDPAARYASAEAFAGDLDRYLDGRPVLARPDSRSYRLRKFVVRHKVGVAATAISLAAMLGGAGVAVSQARVARAERDLARREQARAVASNNFLQSLMQDASPTVPLTPTALLDRGTARLDNATQLDPGIIAYLRYTISTHYLRFNQTAKEIDLLTKAAAGARAAGDLDLVAASECAAAWSLAGNDVEQAAARLAEGEAALASVASPTFKTTTECLRAHGRVLDLQGRIDEAIAWLESGLAALPPPQGNDWAHVSFVRTVLSALYVRRDRFKDALAISEESLAEIRRRGEVGSLNEFTGIVNVAIGLSRVGEARASLDLYREALNWLDRGTFSVTPLGTLNSAGFAELRAGNAAEALRLAEAERAAAEAAGNRSLVALTDLLAARSLLALGRPGESRARIEAAEAVWQTNARGNARLLLEASMHRAELLAAEGQVAAARDAAAAIVSSLGFPTSDTTPGLDRALRLSARLHLQADDPARAAEHAAAALAVARRLARDETKSADVGEAALLHAQALKALGRPAEAAGQAQLAVDALTAGFGADHALTTVAVALLADGR